LEECLESVRAQTHDDFEVVVCDDQSSDGTLDFARALAKADPRFRFASNPRRFGLVGNWNHCISVSRGDWIKFIFQDDVIAPTCVEKLLQACESTGKPFAFCERDGIFGEGVPQWVCNWFANHQQRLKSDYRSGPVIDPDSAARIAVLEPAHNLVGEPTVTLIKASVFHELGVFDEALIQLCDSEFWNRVMVQHGAAFVPERLAFLRIHADATSTLNRTHRAFRMHVLDPLVIRCRYAFGRHYGPIRNPRFTGRSVLKLRIGCALAAADAWKQAVKGIGPDGLPSAGMIAEWNAVAAHCTGLRALAWFGRACSLLRKVRTDLARQIRRVPLPASRD